MHQFNKQSGFSLIDLMIALALFTILVSITVPNLRNWMRGYRIQGAARELYSNMQFAKSGSAKENRQWKLHFDNNGSYNVIKCLTSTCEIGDLDTDYQVVKSIDFSNIYNNDIKYNNPVSSTLFDNNPLVFNSNGLTTQGYIYLSNKEDTKYYRIGLPSFSGSVQIQKWNGSNWE